jgi:hypothetical protein
MKVAREERRDLQLSVQKSIGLAVSGSSSLPSFAALRLGVRFLLFWRLGVRSFPFWRLGVPAALLRFKEIDQAIENCI